MHLCAILYAPVLHDDDTDEREVSKEKNDAVQNIKSEFKIIPVYSEIVSEPPNNK